MTSPQDSCTEIFSILVVDDEQLVAWMLKDALESLDNCEIDAVTSGLQALQLFQQHPYHLVITDYQMPDMDGVTLASKIREISDSTAIMIVTAHADKSLREQAASIFVCRVFEKPMKLKEIRQAVWEALHPPST
jgi:two-component system chemotaxis response regulator CheY